MSKLERGRARSRAKASESKRKRERERGSESERKREREKERERVSWLELCLPFWAEGNLRIYYCIISLDPMEKENMNGGEGRYEVVGDAAADVTKAWSAWKEKVLQNF